MAKKPKSKYLRIERVKSAKKESRSQIKKRKCSLRPTLKREQTSILGRMQGTVIYEADLIKPIDEKWDADSENS